MEKRCLMEKRCRSMCQLANLDVIDKPEKLGGVLLLSGR